MVMDLCRQKHKKRSSTMSQISAKLQKTYVELNKKNKSHCLILPFGAHQGVLWRLFVLLIKTKPCILLLFLYILVLFSSCSICPVLSYSLNNVLSVVFLKMWNTKTAWITLKSTLTSLFKCVRICIRKLEHCGNVTGFKQSNKLESLFDLAVWSSPRSLMTSLCAAD